MPNSTKRISAVIFDWAGTIIDHGSLAPIKALQAGFSQKGIALSEEIARRGMGLAKRAHIQEIVAEREIAQQWFEVHGVRPGDAEVDDLYKAFVPLQLECLLKYADLIEGIIPVAEHLRSLGIRIGGTTGYTRAMLEELESKAREQGFTPDCSLCPEDVGAGRPSPFMCYQLAINLHASPLSACVKIGDTFSDIDEGRNAGMWTVGVLRTGNLIGLSEEDWAVLPREDQQQRLSKAKFEMTSHGAHFTVESVGQLLPVLEEIGNLIDHGRMP